MLKHLYPVLERDGFESCTQRMVCIEAYFSANHKGVIAATQGDIAAACCLSRATVVKQMARLCELGLLTWVRGGRYAIPTQGRVSNGECRQPGETEEVNA